LLQGGKTEEVNFAIAHLLSQDTGGITTFLSAPAFIPDAANPAKWTWEAVRGQKNFPLLPSSFLPDIIIPFTHHHHPSPPDITTISL
jgi:hypothetical protein